LIKEHSVYDQAGEYILQNLSKLTLNDSKVILEAFRSFCAQNSFNPTLIDAIFDRVISAPLSDFNYSILISLIKSAKSIRQDREEIHKKLN